MTLVKAKLVLDITYDTTELQEDGADLVKRHLEALMDTISGNGDLSGYNDMTVEEWSVKVAAHEIKTRITYDEFEEKYVPIKNHLDDNASYDGVMYETFGDEVQYVLSLANDEHHKERVWTVIGDCNATVVLSGYHLVNRLGYIITGKPLEQEYMEVYDPDLIKAVGDEVYWEDIDNEESSGYYTIAKIKTPTGKLTGTSDDDDTIILLTNEDGAETEVCYYEIS
jgi:hypothetical protein